MKKLFFIATSILLVVAVLFTCVACTENNEQLLQKYSKQIDTEMKGCFDYFWNEAQTSASYPDAYGLVADRTAEGSAASIAAVGFGLAAYVVGAEEGYVTKAQAEERTLGTLKTILRLQQSGTNVTESGFLSHFLNMRTGARAAGSEISSIDTSIMLCGALTAGEYFGGEVKELANQIYANVNWTAIKMVQGGKRYWAMVVKNGKAETPWDFYAEQLMMYVLGAGSPTAAYRLDDTEYYQFTRNVGTYGTHRFIYSWFGSIFTYQFSHAFVDFRGVVDKKGTDWWNNSVEASLAAYEYCRDNANKSKSFKEGGWGLTACDRKGSYGGYLGNPPRGWNSNEDSTYSSYEGTIAPYGAIASVVFTPKQSLTALNYYQTSKSLARLNDSYGLKDSYNLDQMWFATDYVGIDKGITLMMLYNFKCDGIWNQFMANEYVQNGMTVLGFTAA